MLTSCNLLLSGHVSPARLLITQADHPAVQSHLPDLLKQLLVPLRRRACRRSRLAVAGGDLDLPGHIGRVTRADIPLRGRDCGRVGSSERAERRRCGGQRAVKGSCGRVVGWCGRVECLERANGVAFEDLAFDLVEFANEGAHVKRRFGRAHVVPETVEQFMLLLT